MVIHRLPIMVWTYSPITAPKSSLRSRPVQGRVVAYNDTIGRDVHGPGLEGNYIIIEPLNACYEQNGLAYRREGAVSEVVLGHLDPGFADPEHPFYLGIEKDMIVEIGMHIAYSDNSGNTNVGPHVHVTVSVHEPGQHKPKPVNPRSIFIDCP